MFCWKIAFARKLRKFWSPEQLNWIASAKNTCLLVIESRQACWWQVLSWKYSNRGFLTEFSFEWTDVCTQVIELSFTNMFYIASFRVALHVSWQKNTWRMKIDVLHKRAAENTSVGDFSLSCQLNGLMFALRTLNLHLQRRLRLHIIPLQSMLAGKKHEKQAIKGICCLTLILM